MPPVHHPTHPDPILVPPRDAARRLAICERTLWGLTARGEIPCVRIGRAVRYAVADLTAYVAAQRQAAAQ